MGLRESPVCPKCGADAPDARPGVPHECRYCGAVSTLEPPAPIVQKIEPEVIRRVVVDAATGATSLTCPRCEIALFEGKADGRVVHGCGRCGGMWLDNVSSTRLLNMVSSPIVDLAERAKRVASTKVETSEPVRCPLDGQPMKRVTSYGIELDACATHGTWFDAGEVKRLVVALQHERLAAAANAPAYDYRPAAEEALRNEAGARIAFQAFGVVLGAIER